MKKCKVSFVAVIALVIAIGVSSFTTLHKTTSQKWFAFSGTGSNTSASNYTPASGGSGADPNCNYDPVMVCAIYATDDGTGHPVASELSDIVRDSDTFQEQLDGLVEYKP